MTPEQEQGTRPAEQMTPTEALMKGIGEDARPDGDVSAAAPGARGTGIDTYRRQGFSIGSLHLMVPYDVGSELTELPTVHRMPNAPEWFLGMANLHGTLVPVFDLARRFGLARPTPERPMLLVLSHDADASGIVIDALPRRLRFDREQLVEDAAIPPALADVVKRAALIEDRLWLDLESEELLDQLESSLEGAA